MKKIKVLLIAIFLISAGSSFQVINAQEKTKAELEKEQKLQQAIELQKKALTDQKKAQAEAEASIDDQNDKLDELDNDLELNIEATAKAGDRVRALRQRGNGVWTTGEPFIINSDGMEFYGHGFGGDGERTTWDFSKSVKENSFTKEYAFDVEKTANTVVMSVMGDCKAGEIRIKIVMPSGKNYSDILIDEFGNLNWRKSFTISETENQDKAGEWKFQINSTKATGFFKISLQTY
jgi:Zn-dependent metalloprotease